MGHIRLDGPQEPLLGGAVEELDLNGLLPPEAGSQETVHSVDHPHVAAGHENGGKALVEFREAGDVLGVLPVETR
ncbi:MULTISPECIES: hypothetical protein [Streptomyces]|uniref:hypothetical protein n=1 Tax=Streptomyces TaxID=1883 RepID=UPI0029ADD825|nr:hypothetical protein [Streptomyces scabiei]MDX3113110.1 hypothetical protein [Streptomyces scabiei]